jgi:hypothetical protein
MDHPNTVYGTATVMEEVGLRGATTSVRAVDPDVAIVLESDIAGDVPGIKPDESAIKLGKGPTVLIYESRTIPNIKLRELILDMAQKESIPVQISMWKLAVQMPEPFIYMALASPPLFWLLLHGTFILTARSSTAKIMIWLSGC